MRHTTKLLLCLAAVVFVVGVAALATLSVLPLSRHPATSTAKPTAPSPSPGVELATLPMVVPAQDVPLDGNYALTLYPVDKNSGVLLAFVVATSNFTVQNEKPYVRFSGTVQPGADGSYLVDYALVSTDEGKLGEFTGNNTTTSASVRLRPGEAVQIVRNNAQCYNLRLDRYNPAAPVKASNPAVAAIPPLAAH